MKTVRYPKKECWAGILARPVFETKSLERHVANILNFVKKDGDQAVRHLQKLSTELRLRIFSCPKMNLPKPR
jgi:histidinol dehydrogenase